MSSQKRTVDYYVAAHERREIADIIRNYGMRSYLLFVDVFVIDVFLLLSTHSQLLLHLYLCVSRPARRAVCMLAVGVVCVVVFLIYALRVLYII